MFQNIPQQINYPDKQLRNYGPFIQKIAVIPLNEYRAIQDIFIPVDVISLSWSFAHNKSYYKISTIHAKVNDVSGWSIFGL